MKRGALALILAVGLAMLMVSVASAGGPCSPKDPKCPGGGPPIVPPGLELGSQAPVRVSPASQILIDITAAGVAGPVGISNSVDGILIDITGAGILIDITGAGLAHKLP